MDPNLVEFWTIYEGNLDKEGYHGWCLRLSDDYSEKDLDHDNHGDPAEFERARDKISCSNFSDNGVRARLPSPGVVIG